MPDASLDRATIAIGELSANVQRFTADLPDEARTACAGRLRLARI